MSRAREEGFVTSEKSKSAANLLHSIVKSLDGGVPAYWLADDVKAISDLMREGASTPCSGQGSENHPPEP